MTTMIISGLSDLLTKICDLLKSNWNGVTLLGVGTSIKEIWLISKRGYQWISMILRSLFFANRFRITRICKWLKKRKQIHDIIGLIDSNPRLMKAITNQQLFNRQWFYSMTPSDDDYKKHVSRLY